MSLKILNRCMFTALTSGLSDFTVGSANLGYLTPANAGASNGDTFYYGAQSQSQADWEIGQATYSSTGPTVQRTSITLSSNANAKVNFSTPPTVFAAMTAEQLAAMFAAASAGVGASTPFTPTDGSTGSTLTFTSITAAYSLLGTNLVFIDINLHYPTNSNTANAAMTIPFTPAQTVPLTTITNSASIVALGAVLSGTANVQMFNTAGGANLRNVDLSNVTVRVSGIIMI